MYLPHSSDLVRRNSMITTPTPLDHSPFTLDTSGVSGFFGGDEAISAMSTVHVYSLRQWLGWYNTPGSFEIARRYGRIAKSKAFKALFPGVRTEAAELFEFDGLQGPKFQAAASGTKMERTGHLSSIFANVCASLDGIPIPGRAGSGVGITIVRLNRVPNAEVDPPRIPDYFIFLLAITPIAVSLGACIASGVYEDWYSCALILWGILSNGLSCFVIGAGTLRFKHHIPAEGSPRGDGILGDGRDFVLILGEEGAVNCITLGKLSLEFPNESYPDYIGCCSILLTIQFLAQLFLIPQASLFGQIMFISSLGASWVYNSILSAIDKEKIQHRILINDVLGKPPVIKYTLTTRTSAVVFALCVLCPEDPSKILEAYLPNDTNVWRKWKETISQRLLANKALYFTDADWNLAEYTDQEKKLLATLYGDAQAAYGGFHAREAPEKRSSVHTAVQ